MFKATTSLGIPIANDPLSDFRKFLFVIWKHLNLPDPTPVQYDIACNLQHGDKRMIIEAFRGVGKSWLTSAYVVWLLYMNPQLNILVVSASKSRSDDFTTFTLRLINEIEVLPTCGQSLTKDSPRLALMLHQLQLRMPHQ